MYRFKRISTYSVDIKIDFMGNIKLSKFEGALSIFRNRSELVGSEVSMKPCFIMQFGIKLVCKPNLFLGSVSQNLPMEFRAQEGLLCWFFISFIFFFFFFFLVRCVLTVGASFEWNKANVMLY